MTEKLLEVENETMMKVADLEKLLIQKDKELNVIRVSHSPISCSPRIIKASDSVPVSRDQVHMLVAKLLY